MEQLLQLADDLGITVIERRGGSIGGYHEDSRTIRLSPGQKRRVARSVLAHEIGHHVFGDVYTPFGPMRSRQERRANEWAALYLIDEDTYIEVEHLRDGHLASMAYDLDVTVELVTAYQGLLIRNQAAHRPYVRA